VPCLKFTANRSWAAGRASLCSLPELQPLLLLPCRLTAVDIAAACAELLPAQRLATTCSRNTLISSSLQLLERSRDASCNDETI
jgi:hypothetical protein